MNYHAYELAHALVSPMRMATQNLRLQLDFPFNVLGKTPLGRGVSAACEVFENLTRRDGQAGRQRRRAPNAGRRDPTPGVVKHAGGDDNASSSFLASRGSLRP